MGEVSGKKLQPDAFFLDTPSCQPCSRDEEFLTAEAFCTVCKEFLCSTCTSVHRKLKVSKGHTIQDKFSMPGSITGLENEMKHEDQDSQSCEKHPSEFIKYFCPEHQVCLCGHCLALKHRNCEVEIISEISNDFKDSQEYEDINADIAQLLEGIDRCSIDAERNISVVQRLGERELSKLRSYRKEVNKKFADREKELIDLIEIKRTADENLMR
ncbi:E3 ubiquitin-protein ligase TRIM33-like [Mya arenaria]|uniref:E3 ubiquitin-protein ligase TRIM33-like n=1 Tax=Mya arenaria TaxID=6604 RepID=UPI0022E81F82|nr:E3 ubiquitin-protein ligase TRIM33-like [Mya arenaria]